MNTQNNLVEKAITKAMKLHEGQLRKGDSGIPYIVHPLEVGILVARYVTDTGLIAAAILHDTVEDTKYTIEELEADFGPEVRNLVAALTEDKSLPEWVDRKNENLGRLRQNQDAYFIKSVDILANMRSLLAVIQDEGQSAWSRFNATQNQMMEYYKIILQDTEDFLPKKLIEEYVSALKDLEYSEFMSKKGALGF